MTQSTEIEARTRKVFGRVLRKKFGNGNIQAKKVEEWDSLAHIELIMALEEEFDIEIDPDSIAALFSDLNTILKFINETLRDKK